MLIKYKASYPQIHHTCFIAEGAKIIGQVSIGAHSSIWFNTVIRGDVATITIGERTNIQDNSVIHVTRPSSHTVIGSNVTVGHMALLHACEIQDYAFVGMGAIVMDKAVIETRAMVAAGALVTQGQVVKTGQIWAGRPAKLLRKMTEQEFAYLAISAQNYVNDAATYLALNPEEFL